MTTLRALLVMASLVSVAAAQTPPQQAPQAPQEMPAADVKLWLEFFDKLVVTVAQSDGTCDKMATDVSTLTDQHKSAIAIARNARAHGRKLPAYAHQRMVDGVKAMVPAMQKCGTHDKVRAAFAKLDLSRRG